MPQENENYGRIELRSEEVQEILGTPPAWLVRWGITVVCIIVVGLVAMSWIMKYPDIIPAQISITTPNPPAPVVTKTSGKVYKILVSEGDSVTKDQPLLIMENTANEEDVFRVEAYLAELDDLEPRKIAKYEMDEDLELGELQGAYSSFKEAFETYKYSIKSKYDFRNIKKLEDQIEQTHELNKAMEKQQLNLEQELKIAEKNRDRQKKLFEDGVISEKDYEDVAANFIRRQREVENINVSIINNEIRISQLEKQITDIKKDMKLTNSTKYIRLRENADVLQSEIGNWEKKYLLTAPISGFVNLNYITKLGQFIEAGKEAMMILPEEGEIVGQVALPIAGSGKVKPEQDVNIKLESFPFREYGMLRGKVRNISPFPRGDNYLIEVGLPEGLKTSHGETLDFRQNMLGVAEIITEDKRLFDRIFEQLQNVLEPDHSKRFKEKQAEKEQQQQ